MSAPRTHPAAHRVRKPSTVAGYRSIVGSELLPRVGTMALEAVTPGEIESWQASMIQAASARTKALVLMHGIFERARKVWSLSSNPVADVEKPPVTRSGDLQVCSSEPGLLGSHSGHPERTYAQASYSRGL